MEDNDRTPVEHSLRERSHLGRSHWADHFDSASDRRPDAGWLPYLIGAIVIGLWINVLRLLL